MFELFFIFLNGLNDLQYTNNLSSTPLPHNKQMYKQMDGWMDGWSKLLPCSLFNVVYKWIK